VFFEKNNEITVYNVVKLIRMIFEFHKNDNMIDRRIYNKYVTRITPLVIHPNKWIRNETMQFLRIVLDKFSPAYIFTKFHKLFKYFFKEDIILLKSNMVSYAFLDPLSRSEYDKLLENKLLDRNYDFSFLDKMTQRKCRYFNVLFVKYIKKQASISDYEVI
jgi:hypothetical protein